MGSIIGSAQDVTPWGIVSRFPVSHGQGMQNESSFLRYGFLSAALALASWLLSFSVQGLEHVRACADMLVKKSDPQMMHVAGTIFAFALASHLRESGIVESNTSDPRLCA